MDRASMGAPQLLGGVAACAISFAGGVLLARVFNNGAPSVMMSAVLLVDCAFCAHSLPMSCRDHTHEKCYCSLTLILSWSRTLYFSTF